MKRKICIILAAVFTAAFLVSGFMLCRQYLDEKNSAEAFEDLAQLVETLPPDSGAPEEETETPMQTAFEKYAELYDLNDDMIGWISIDGTNINYPVMQTKDRPDYYLKRSFERQYSDYGVPYVSESCDVDVSDNTVIYGHHMKNGTMFSDLCRYTSQDFYEQHKIIRFDTLGGFGEYEIVAVFKTVVYSEAGFKYYRYVNFEDETAFDEFISECNALALYDTGVEAEYGDKLITLSTCEYSRTNGRMVVVARKLSGVPARPVAWGEEEQRSE